MSDKLCPDCGRPFASTTEEKRRALYRALIEECKGNWGSVTDIAGHVPDHENLEGYLEGLVTLRELEKRDNGDFTFYHLTEFGERWAEMDLARD